MPVPCERCVCLRVCILKPLETRRPAVNVKERLREEDCSCKEKSLFPTVCVCVWETKVQQKVTVHNANDELIKTVRAAHSGFQKLRLSRRDVLSKNRVHERATPSHTQSNYTTLSASFPHLLYSCWIPSGPRKSAKSSATVTYR